MKLMCLAWVSSISDDTIVPHPALSSSSQTMTSNTRNVLNPQPGGCQHGQHPSSYKVQYMYLNSFPGSLMAGLFLWASGIHSLSVAPIVMAVRPFPMRYKLEWNKKTHLYICECNKKSHFPCDICVNATGNLTPSGQHYYAFTFYDTDLRYLRLQSQKSIFHGSKWPGNEIFQSMKLISVF